MNGFDEIARAARGQASRFYDIEPTPYVRQTQADKWKKRPEVLRYRAFRDEVAWMKLELPEDFFHVVFLIETPRSWSAKKRLEHIGQPHLCKPDKDNLEKGLIDAVYRNRDDAHIWNGASTKIWAGLSGIVVSDTWIPFWELPVDLPALVRGTLHTVDSDPDV
jgi:Holliday junction resolvase RusA-like endonuclease